MGRKAKCRVQELNLAKARNKVENISTDGELDSFSQLFRRYSQITKIRKKTSADGSYSV